jgi:VWFA-related protein
LRIDGKVQPSEFFEMVSAGSSHDEEIWARAENKPIPPVEQPGTKAQNPGRILLFFVDDWHLSADSVMRCRVALSNLIAHSVERNDKVGIFAASGQLGSAQTLTGDKAALLSILQRFNFLSAGVEDLAYPPMNETQALLIEQNDPDVITYFARAMAGTSYDPVARARIDDSVEKAKPEVRKRAAALAQTSAAIAERFLSALRSFLRSAEALQGRKLVFLSSDGFVLQPQRSDIVFRLGEVTTAAARAGILIYSLDARGLVVGLPDAKVRKAPDPVGELAHSGYNEVISRQDALNALAADTGGRFLSFSNIATQAAEPGNMRLDQGRCGRSDAKALLASACSLRNWPG